MEVCRSRAGEVCIRKRPTTESDTLVPITGNILTCMIFCKMIYSFNIRIVNVHSGQPVTGAESASALIGTGSSVGGVVAGVVAALLVEGILYGCWKLKHFSGKSSNVKSEEK